MINNSKWKINKRCAQCSQKIVDTYFACDVALCSQHCSSKYVKFILTHYSSAPEKWPTHKSEGIK